MNSGESRNFILAIVLSALVLIGWNFFLAPKMPGGGPLGQHTETTATSGAAQPAGSNAAAPLAGAAAAPTLTRAEALAASKRVEIDTPSLGGSIDLDRRPDRRCRAEGLPRDDRPQERADQAVLAGRTAPTPIGPRPALSPRAARVKTPTRTTVWTASQRQADARPARDADLGQWRRASSSRARSRSTTNTCSRSTDSVENTGAGAGDAPALCADPAPRQAGGLRLRRAARRLRRRHRRQFGAGNHLRQHREGDQPRPRADRATAAGSASPTNIGRPRSSPTRSRRSTRASWRPATLPNVDYQTDVVGARQDAGARRKARRRRPACSPAPRKSTRSTPIRSSTTSRSST